MTNVNLSCTVALVLAVYGVHWQFSFSYYDCARHCGRQVGAGQTDGWNCDR
ncbi:MAG: hypothetical protein ACI9RO_000681 [Alteromonas macleodii]|jgi:hypothetical protein